MTNNNNNNIDNASKIAVNEGHEHVTLSFVDGKLVVQGSEHLVVALLAKEDLTDQLSELLEENAMESSQPHNHASNKVPEYPLLPCSPYSSQWKGSSYVRKVLRDMLVVAGVRFSGKKKSLGMGQAPMGWPSHIIAWENFSGSTRYESLEVLKKILIV